MKQDSSSKAGQDMGERIDPGEANGRVIELPITSGMGLPPLHEAEADGAVPPAAQTSPHSDFDEFDGDELPGAEAGGFKPVVLCSPENLNFRK